MADLLFVCSPGGHFDEIRLIASKFDTSRYKFVVHGLKKLPTGLDIIIAPHTDRDWRIILQFLFAIYCIFKERPKVIISTGASIAVPFILIAKVFRIKTVYVESPTRVINPSLTARIVQYFASRLYVRYSTLKPKLYKAIFVENRNGA